MRNWLAGTSHTSFVSRQTRANCRICFSSPHVSICHTFHYIHFEIYGVLVALAAGLKILVGRNQMHGIHTLENSLHLISGSDSITWLRSTKENKETTKDPSCQPRINIESETRQINLHQGINPHHLQWITFGRTNVRRHISTYTDESSSLGV